MLCKTFPHQGKLVGDTPIWWELGTESQRRKQLVAVVVLDDLPDGAQGHGVVIQLVRAHVMERGGLGWVACAPNIATQQNTSQQHTVVMFPSPAFDSY